ncbi:delta-endotoxin CytB [Phlegmacium glaucopus]|nr:delta-endotoxin CytB [Phlegmacium glaucopus]
MSYANSVQVNSPNDAGPFQPLNKLPADLIHTSIQVSQFVGPFVIIKDDVKYFDWPGFKKRVDDYSGGDLSFDAFKDTNISRTESTVSTMVDKIVAFLQDALSVALDEKALKQLTATITATFTNLKESKSEGWASFNRESSSNNSSWEYRLLFAIPMEDVPTFFYSLVTTIKLIADIHEESSWWGLKSSSSKNFSAEIMAMELVVEKNFKNPRDA